MLIRKILGCLSVLCGTLMLGMAWNPSAIAEPYNCTPQTYPLSKCDEAHEGPKWTGTPTFDCVMDNTEKCVPAAGSACGIDDMGWGSVYKGVCLFSLDSRHSKCTLDQAATVVELHHWRSTCEADGSTCYCRFQPITDGPKTQIEVCDCATIKTN
ncbi:MAG: hypothetical protein R3C01_10255 [Planctomycetaceae bacterium]